MFAGHTDVVPPGDEAAWHHRPLPARSRATSVRRGAVDMKGGIACFVAAALDDLDASGGKLKG